MAGRERATWRDRFGEGATCVRCLAPHDLMLLDRMLWCDRCRATARDRAGWWGWVAGVLFGAAVSLYVWLVIRPTDLVIGGWVGTIIAAIWIGSRISREVAYGAMRLRNARGVEAESPDAVDQGTAQGGPPA